MKIIFDKYNGALLLTANNIQIYHISYNTSSKQNDWGNSLDLF